MLSPFPSTVRRVRRAVALAVVAILGLVLLRRLPVDRYTEDELRVICERRGGWWRGNLIPGYCEYQTAANQAP